MDKIKRNERLGAMTRILTDTPNRIHTLSEFCALFGAAKSTVSEDIDLISASFERFDLGRIETVAGAAGGVRYRAISSPEKVKRVLTDLSARLSEPGRMLPGGFLYTSDIVSESATAQAMGEILAARYMGEGVQQTQIVQPIQPAGAAQAYAPAQPEVSYKPMTFSVYNPQTGTYEVQELPQMQTPAAQPAQAPAAQAPAAQVPAVSGAQPPALIWDPATGQYLAQPNPYTQVAAEPIQTAKPLAKPKAEKTEKPQKTYVQTLLDSFSKSATTSAGREIGRQLTRGLLGIFGIGKKR